MKCYGCTPLSDSLPRNSQAGAQPFSSDPSFTLKHSTSCSFSNPEIHVCDCPGNGVLHQNLLSVWAPTTAHDVLPPKEIEKFWRCLHSYLVAFNNTKWS